MVSITFAFAVAVAIVARATKTLTFCSPHLTAVIRFGSPWAELSQLALMLQVLFFLFCYACALGFLLLFVVFVLLPFVCCFAIRFVVI